MQFFFKVIFTFCDFIKIKGLKKKNKEKNKKKSGEIVQFDTREKFEKLRVVNFQVNPK